VYIEQLGNIDLAAMYKITTSERMLQNLAVEYEKLADPRLPACSRKAGSLLETCCTIMDLKGVGISKVSSVYSYVKQASAMSQNYYPERLGRLYLINAPWGFSTVFSVVKGWLDPITVEKIHVLGSGYQKELLSQVPIENLPKIFGGTCDCPGGCALSDEGPWTDPAWVRLNLMLLCQFYVQKRTAWDLFQEPSKKQNALWSLPNNSFQALVLVKKILAK
jgi:hypothetical protein